MADNIAEIRELLEARNVDEDKVIKLMGKLSSGDAKKAGADKELRKLSTAAFNEDEMMQAINALRLTGKDRAEWMKAAGIKVFAIVEQSDFKKSAEGVSLNQKLFDQVTALAQHLIDNNLVTGDIAFSEGVRGPKTAHQWSTAYWIQKGAIGEDRLKALPGGKDADGNLWYKEGWTKKEIDANAHSIWHGARANEGYPKGDKRRLPNTDDPDASTHCFGEAIDIKIPWRNGNGWHKEANDLVKQFKLQRPEADEHWHFEL